EWRTDPFVPVKKNGRIYGRGSADAKGPVACMIAAVEALARIKDEITGEIILTAVADEEAGSGGTRSLLPDLRADMAIVGEPTGCDIAIAHKGTATAQMVVKGRSAHAAVPEKGVNAIDGAASAIASIREYHESLRKRNHKLLGSPSAAVTLVKGGTKSNMIPDYCEFTISRRMIPGESEATVAKELGDLCTQFANATPSVAMELAKFFRSSGDPSETPADAEIVRVACKVVSALTGKPAVPGGFPLNCDMALLRGVAGIPTIVLGPGDTSIAHQPDEFVTEEQLDLAASIYAGIILETNGAKGAQK
ncbi:MAG: M20 family metallopeptidase, partial [Vulcanimicrobiaceae bacterium]